MTELSIDQAFVVAMQHHQAGRLSQAEQIYRAILARQPGHADALHLLGVIAHQGGNHELAVELIGRSIGIKPNDAQAQNNLSSALCALERAEEGIAAAELAIRLDPHLAEAFYNLGIGLKKKGEPAKAAVAYRQAIALRPNYGDAHGNLGNVLMDLGDVEAAIASYRIAVGLSPNSAEAHNNLGTALHNAGDLLGGESERRQAILLKSDFALAHQNLALNLLLRGNFAQGWEEYEWRLKIADTSGGLRRFTQERWDGLPLNGRTILLHAEQGMGDTIHFFRYLPMVSQCGGKVIIECQPQLQRLLQRMTQFPVVAAGLPLPAFDVHCPLASLGRVFGTTLETIPKNVPYIEADPAMVDQWRIRLGEGRGMKVGLAWAGNPAFRMDRTRSISLDRLAPLGQVSGATFYSLQKGQAAAQAKQPPAGLRLIDLSEELGDFADTAAAMAAMDLIITTDTSVPHLAGAMGRPVWVMLQYIPDWRWMLDRTDSPWYPTMTLFRQGGLGDWDGVIREVAEALGGVV